jgi:hypothetical protein
MMLRKWSVVVAAAVVLGSVGLAGAQEATSAAGQASVSTSAERKFQVNSRELSLVQDANGRRKTVGLVKVSVNDRASHRLNVVVEQDITGRSEHKLVIEDTTANLKLEYTHNAQTSAATILFKNSTVRVAAGPNGTWTVDGRPFPTTEAAAKALAEDGRLAGIAPELLGGLVIGLDVVLGATTTPRLDVAWQAAVATKG